MNSISMKLILKKESLDSDSLNFSMTFCIFCKYTLKQSICHVF